MLEVRGLRLEREDGVHLLGPLDLALGPGERLGLVGESGSGKSLLVQALFGVLPRGVRQAAGEVLADGRPLAPGDLGRRLAWVPQDPLQALNPFMRLGDQVALPRQAHLGESRGAALAALAPLFDRLRLPSDPAFLARHPHEVSGGQRQRLVLAQALSCGPECLVLDEPTTALDPTVQAEFLDLMAGLDVGFLWITHDLGVAAAATTRLLVLYGGEPLEAGPTREVLDAPGHPYTRRLLQAARFEPSEEAGTLPAPGERPEGCPFRPRCPEALPSCARWAPWKGLPARGLRCEARPDPMC